jgi:hypothetical protein
MAKRFFPKAILSQGKEDEFIFLIPQAFLPIKSSPLACLFLLLKLIYLWLKINH